jgi:hypothetical protein
MGNMGFWWEEMGNMGLWRLRRGEIWAYGGYGEENYWALEVMVRQNGKYGALEVSVEKYGALEVMVRRNIELWRLWWGEMGLWRLRREKKKKKKVTLRALASRAKKCAMLGSL